MKHFTSLNIWRKAVSMMMFLVGTLAASAMNFSPTPTTFSVTDINGSYEIKLATCESANMAVEIVNLTDYAVVDANGTKVPYVFVTPEMKDDYTVTLTVANAENVANGTYYIKVPAGAFCLTLMNNITNDAFDVTLNLNGQGSVDPDPDPEVDPSREEDVATFVLDDHKSDTSIYFHDGDIIECNAAATMLKFERVGVDGDYTTCYKSNGGFVQFKDCAFTISAPYGKKISKIQFEDGAPQSTMYDPDNIEAEGYEDCVWTGDAESVTFSTKEISTPIYDVDEEDNEYVSGYTTTVTGARISKIYVTIKGIGTVAIEGIHATATSAEMFDLAGRRTNAAHGVTIMNGKKVIR